MGTISVTENVRIISGATFATHTITIPSATYKNAPGATKVIISPPTTLIKVNTKANNRVGVMDSFCLHCIVNGVEYGSYNYYFKEYTSYTANVNLSYPPYSGYAHNWEIPLSSIFTSANKTAISVPLTFQMRGLADFITTYRDEFGQYPNVAYRSYATGVNVGSVSDSTIQLDAPPTFNETFSYTGDFSGVPYANLTTASVSLSDLTAYYGGDFSGVGNAEFIIGSQSVSKPNPVNGDVLSIALNAVGTFTPTVKITDSRGQVTTHTLSAITVMGYNAPTVSFDASRTLSDGTPDDEGTYAFIEATFNFTDVIADAVAPSVVVTDDDGTVTTPVVDWYTDAGLTTPVTWSSLSSGDTVYGIFSGLSTQHSYTVSIRPRDSEGTGTAVTQTIGAAFYTVDFLAGGHGIAFGKPASNVGFECAMRQRSRTTLLYLCPTIKPQVQPTRRYMTQ